MSSSASTSHRPSLPPTAAAGGGGAGGPSPAPAPRGVTISTPAPDPDAANQYADPIPRPRANTRRMPTLRERQQMHDDQRPALTSAALYGVGGGAGGGGGGGAFAKLSKKGARFFGRGGEGGSDPLVGMVKPLVLASAGGSDSDEDGAASHLDRTQYSNPDEAEAARVSRLRDMEGLFQIKIKETAKSGADVNTNVNTEEDRGAEGSGGGAAHKSLSRVLDELGRQQSKADRYGWRLRYMRLTNNLTAGGGRRMWGPSGGPPSLSPRASEAGDRDSIANGTFVSPNAPHQMRRAASPLPSANSIGLHHAGSAASPLGPSGGAIIDGDLSAFQRLNSPPTPVAGAGGGVSPAYGGTPSLVSPVQGPLAGGPIPPPLPAHPPLPLMATTAPHSPAVTPPPGALKSPEGSGLRSPHSPDGLRLVRRGSGYFDGFSAKSAVDVDAAVLEVYHVDVDPAAKTFTIKGKAMAIPLKCMTLVRRGRLEEKRALEFPADTPSGKEYKFGHLRLEVLFDTEEGGDGAVAGGRGGPRSPRSLGSPTRAGPSHTGLFRSGGGGPHSPLSASRNGIGGRQGSGSPTRSGSGGRWSISGLTGKKKGRAGEEGGDGGGGSGASAVAAVGPKKTHHHELEIITSTAKERDLWYDWISSFILHADLVDLHTDTRRAVPSYRLVRPVAGVANFVDFFLSGRRKTELLNNVIGGIGGALGAGFKPLMSGGGGIAKPPSQGEIFFLTPFGPAPEQRCRISSPRAGEAVLGFLDVELDRVLISLAAVDVTVHDPLSTSLFLTFSAPLAAAAFMRQVAFVFDPDAASGLGGSGYVDEFGDFIDGGFDDDDGNDTTNAIGPDGFPRRDRLTGLLRVSTFEFRMETCFERDQMAEWFTKVSGRDIPKSAPFVYERDPQHLARLAGAAGVGVGVGGADGIPPPTDRFLFSRPAPLALEGISTTADGADGDRSVDASAAAGADGEKAPESPLDLASDDDELGATGGAAGGPIDGSAAALAANGLTAEINALLGGDWWDTSAGGGAAGLLFAGDVGVGNTTSAFASSLQLAQHNQSHLLHGALQSVAEASGNGGGVYSPTTAHRRPYPRGDARALIAAIPKCYYKKKPHPSTATPHPPPTGAVGHHGVLHGRAAAAAAAAAAAQHANHQRGVTISAALLRAELPALASNPFLASLLPPPNASDGSRFVPEAVLDVLARPLRGWAMVGYNEIGQLPTMGAASGLFARRGFAIDFAAQRIVVLEAAGGRGRGQHDGAEGDGNGMGWPSGAASNVEECVRLSFSDVSCVTAYSEAYGSAGFTLHCLGTGVEVTVIPEPLRPRCNYKKKEKPAGSGGDSYSSSSNSEDRNDSGLNNDSASLEPHATTNTNAAAIDDEDDADYQCSRARWLDTLDLAGCDVKVDESREDVNGRYLSSLKEERARLDAIEGVDVCAANVAMLVPCALCKKRSYACDATGAFHPDALRRLAAIDRQQRLQQKKSILQELEDDFATTSSDDFSSSVSGGDTDDDDASSSGNGGTKAGSIGGLLSFGDSPDAKKKAPVKKPSAGRQQRRRGRSGRAAGRAYTGVHAAPTSLGTWVLASIVPEVRAVPADIATNDAFVNDVIAKAKAVARAAERSLERYDALTKAASARADERSARVTATSSVVARTPVPGSSIIL